MVRKKMDFSFQKASAFSVDNYFSLFFNALQYFESLSSRRKHGYSNPNILHNKYTHNLNILMGKQKQKKDKHTGYTTVAYLMKLKACIGEKEPLSFHTNATAYLMKWFNFSDENYFTQNEHLSLACEM